MGREEKEASCVLLTLCARPHSMRTKEQHVEKVGAAIPEGPLLKGLAVADEEKHVKYKVQPCTWEYCV